MAIVLNITKNSASYLNMRIFRDTVKANVYNGPAIADVAIAATYTDNTAANGVQYYYGVELYHATDKTRFLATPAFVLSDFGPFTAQVQSNLTKLGSVVQHGSNSLGIIEKNTLLVLASQPGVANVKTKMEEIFAAAGVPYVAQPGNDMQMNALLLDGKLVVLATGRHLTFPVSVYSTGTVQVKALRDYLVATPAQSFIDIAGYRWRIKLLTKEQLIKYPALGHTQPTAINAATDLRTNPVIVIDIGGQNDVLVWSDDAARVEAVSFSSQGAPGFTYSVAANAPNRQLFTLIYFEYEGAVP